jgi:hypothetical protein
MKTDPHKQNEVSADLHATNTSTTTIVTTIEDFNYSGLRRSILEKGNALSCEEEKVTTKI